MTAEQVLSNLPLAITLWTAITLCWGVCVHHAYKQMQLTNTQARQGITSNIWFVIVANTILASFLLLESLFAQYADAIIVINVFYSAHLFTASLSVCKWWKSQQKTQSTPPNLS